LRSFLIKNIGGGPVSNTFFLSRGAKLKRVKLKRVKLKKAKLKKAKLKKAKPSQQRRNRQWGPCFKYFFKRAPRTGGEIYF
jgi:hypothetical protein